MQHGALVYENIEDMIGKTPLVRIKKSLKKVPVGEWLNRQKAGLSPAEVTSQIYAKIEMQNPGGSVKDRIALAIVNAAEKSGALKPGGTLVEATSGNTGAGLALIAASRGYKAVLCMPDKMSAEKVNALRAFGARVVITPTKVSTDHPDYYCNAAIRLAKEIPGAVLANQYFNPENPGAHYLSTGPEIWEQMKGHIDVFVAGIGTGGTLSGTAKYLREKNPKLKVVAIDPKGSIYYEEITNKKKVEQTPYLVEGIGEDMLPGTMDLSLPDVCIPVNDLESFSATRILAQREGLLVGGSCGSAFFGALQYLRLHESQGGAPLRAVVILPDSGSRYLSKVFNTEWLSRNNALSTWNDENLGGDVEYLTGTKKIEGV